MALGLDPNWVLSLGERELLTWIIAVGEARGGEWDYDNMRWHEKKKPIADEPGM